MKTCLVQAATGANIYLGLGNGHSGPVNGQHDPLLAAAALAFPIGIEVDLGDNPARYGGLLFRVGGTNPVVLISYD